MAQEILAIIPARGGSKRVPKKNIKKLCGKPLIQYTIETAKKSIVDDVIVSTEDKEIIDVVQKCGGVRTIRRPKTLSTDWAKTIDAVLDVLRYENPDIVVCLQPTSPFRSAQDIDNAVELFMRGGCESVISVCEIGQRHTWFLRIDKNYLAPVFGHKYLNGKKNLPKMYIPNGAIYVSTPQLLKKYKSFYTGKILPYVMPEERSIDVDDSEDLLRAQLILRKKL